MKTTVRELVGRIYEGNRDREIRDILKISPDDVMIETDEDGRYREINNRFDLIRVPDVSELGYYVE